MSKKLKAVIKFNVSKHFSTYIAYGDDSGLEEGEAEKVDELLKDYPTNVYTYEFGKEKYDNINRCDISGLDSDTVKLKIYKV